jgi:hypothetical protein
MPAITQPKTAKPRASRRELSPRLMYICVVRESGPALANDRLPRTLLRRTESSGMRWRDHAALTAESPLRPNCATNPSTTRKKRAPS